METKYNTKIKVYSDDYYTITFCNHKIFKPKNLTSKKYIKKSTEPTTTTTKPISYKNLFRSCKRAKERIFDIVYLNRFDYFLTLTFDPKKVDSFSPSDVMKYTRYFFYSLKYIFKDFKYILVPEYHVSGRIHIHALCTYCPSLFLVKSSVSDSIFNVTSWKYGYSTAKKISYDDTSSMKIALYISKYITKNVKKIFGKYYWSSKNLKRDVETIYLDNDYTQVDLLEHEVPTTGIKLKYLSHFDIKK